MKTNELETKETIEKKSMKLKFVFKNINKIDKSLARLRKKGKTQIKSEMKEEI